MTNPSQQLFAKSKQEPGWQAVRTIVNLKIQPEAALLNNEPGNLEFLLLLLFLLPKGRVSSSLVQSQPPQILRPHPHPRTLFADTAESDHGGSSRANADRNPL